VLWVSARKLGFQGPVITAWHQGLKWRHYLSSELSACTYVGARFEPNELAYMVSVLTAGMTVLDAGANEGAYTLVAASICGADGAVHAVEPSSRERFRLEQNIALNNLGNVRVHPLALGSTSGSATLRVAENDHAGHNTLGSFAHPTTRSVYQELVPVSSVDELVLSAGIKRMDFWKMDIEGSEGDALRGASRTLRTLRPRILMELQQASLTGLGSSTEMALALLTEADYTIFSFGAGGELTPYVASDEFGMNIVALPAELTRG
jgi:FkbM family methyltransferase